MQSWNDSEVEILLVEDNRNDLELTLHALKKKIPANRIHVVRDGAEAIDFVFGAGQYSDRNVNEIPRLILLDLKLAKLNGLEVLKRIKENAHTSPIPIVVLTSSTEERDIVEAYKLRVNSYIVKPVEFDKFTEITEQIGHYWLLLNRQRSAATFVGGQA